MKTTLYLSTMLFFLTTGLLHGQTDVAGNLNADTRWTLAGSPYTLTGDVIVREGVTLTIDAGVEVVFPNRLRDLYVYGNLQANGTGNQGIRFRGSGNDEEHGGGLYLLGTGVGSQTTYTLRNVSFMHLGDDGSEFDASIVIADGDATLENVTVEDNESVFPIRISPRMPERLTLNNSGIDKLHIYRNDILTSLNWPDLGIELQMEDYLEIFGEGELFISPGVNILMPSAANSFYVYGKMEAVGTVTNPVSFRGNGDAENHAGGIYFTNDGNGRLENIILEHAGDNNSWYSCALYFDQSNVSIQNVQLLDIEAPYPARATPNTPSWLDFQDASIGKLYLRDFAMSDTIRWPASPVTYSLEDETIINSNGLLKIEAGVKIELVNGGGLSAYGRIEAIGTPDRPIEIFGVEDNIFGGFILLSESEGNQFNEVTFTNVKGYSNWRFATLSVGAGASATVTSCRFVDVKDHSINNVSENLTVSNSCFGQATVAAVGNYSFANDPVDARNNYWNSPSGPTNNQNPSGTGAAVSNNVLFEPWLNECPGVVANDLAITEIVSPDKLCEDESFEIVVVVNNLGSAPVNSFSVSYNMDIIGSDTRLFPAIAPGERRELTLASNLTLPPGNNYNLAVEVINSGDQRLANNTKTSTVEVRETFNATVTPQEVTVCAGTRVLAEAEGGATYLWSTGSTFSAVAGNFFETTTLTVTVTNDIGCVDVDTVMINVDPLPERPVITVSADRYCPGGSVTLTSSVTDNIRWSTEEFTQSIEVSEPGSYSVTHVDPMTGCEVTSFSRFIFEAGELAITFNGTNDVCLGDSKRLSIFGASSILWSTGETTTSITVTPTETTTYTATAVDPYGCRYELSQTITVSPRITPGAVSGMLPLDGSTDVPTRTTFSWAPADNATHYSLFIWRTGETQPTFPLVSNIYGISQIITNLSPGVSYSWFIVSANACEAGIAGPIQTFTAVSLADLVVRRVTGPTTAFSGEEITLTWEVFNQGEVATGNREWDDYIYLSTDPIFSSNARFIGRRQNTSALSVNTDYGAEFTYRLPDCLEGDYYVLVRANGNRRLPELDRTNNLTPSSTVTAISLSPKPDLVVTRLVPPGTAGILQEGESYVITWDIENRGTAATSGQTRTDRIYYSREPQDNPFTRVPLKTFTSNEIISASETRTFSTDIDLPEGLTDTVYLFVLIDFTDTEEECLFEENNREFTGPLRIIEAPRPDFEALGLTLPSQVSSGEEIEVNWSLRNTGIDYAGDLFCRVIFAENDQPGPLQRSVFFSVTGDFLTGVTRSGRQRVTIPTGISGQKVVALQVNTPGGVDEGSRFNDGNYFNSATEILVPDLEVSQPRSSAPTVVAGGELEVSWELTNRGAGTIRNTVVRDEVALVSTGAADRLSQAVTLTPSQTNGRRLRLRVPAGTPPGSYLLRVRTNVNQNVFENGRTDNNTATANERIRVVAAATPDLRPLSVVVSPTSITGGTPFTLTYSATNSGADPTSGNWQDKVYLSRSAVFNSSNSFYLGSRPQSRRLQPGEHYTETASFTFPSRCVSGNYFVHVIIDAGNREFEENELNNEGVSGQISYSTVPTNLNVDLELRDVIVDTLVPGQSSVLSWRTRNTGTSTMATTAWNDELFVSADEDFDPAVDLRIGSWPRNGALVTGGGYTRLETFTIPDTLSLETYYLILVTDAGGLTQDNDRNNNAVVLSTNEDGTTTVVTVPDKPDLTVRIDAVLDPAITGQPLRVVYTVTNEGDVVLNGSGQDHLVVSGNQAYSPFSPSVGRRRKSWNLAPGASIRDTVMGTIPSQVSGNNFLALKTDAGSSVAESNELNNTDEVFVLVNLPPPGDLAVQQTLAPAAAQTNDTITVNWTLVNQGINTVNGYLEQSIYLSRDATWDITDPELGRWRGIVDLAENATVDLQQELCLTDISDGNYFVIVRADILDNIVETDNENNDGASTFPIDISMPELVLEVPKPATLNLRKPLYHKFVVDESLRGETVKISLTSPDGEAVNELYVRYDSIPSRTVFDQRYDVPFAANQEVFLSELRVGTYYVMAYAAAGPPTQNVGLLAEIVPFALTDVNAAAGGNTGPVTVALSGTRFADGMTIFLDNGPGGIISASNVLVRGTRSAFATFELAGASLGTYDVTAISSDGTDESTLLQAFRIVSGTNPTSSPTLTCSADGSAPLRFDELSQDVGNPLELEKIHPAYARQNQKIALTFRYVNEGNVDVVLPQLLISSLGGAPLSLDPELFDPESLELGMEFQETDGPPDVLRPGAVATYTVYTHATSELLFRLY